MAADLAFWLQALPAGVLVSYLQELRGFNARQAGVGEAIELLRDDLWRREHAGPRRKARDDGSAIPQDARVAGFLLKSRELLDRSQRCRLHSAAAITRMRLLTSRPPDWDGQPSDNAWEKALRVALRGSRN